MSQGMGNGGGLELLWGLGIILVVVGIVIVAAWAVMRVTPGSTTTSAPAGPEALELLRLRFAKGEISEAEFTQAKRVLGYER